MNTDIRIAVSFKGNRKRKKFKMLLGDPSATDYLIDFWLSVATDRPEGDLSGLENLDIALMAGWEGDSEQFVRALIAAGFLDGQPGEYQVHAWAEHNGYASNAAARSEAARKASNARWAAINGIPEYDEAECDGIATGMRPHKKRNPPSPSPLPSPLPSPDKSLPAQPGYAKSFKKWTREDLEADVQIHNHDGILIPPEEVEEFIDYWMEPTPSGRPNLALQKTWCTRRRMKNAVAMIFERRRKERRQGDRRQDNYDPFAGAI